MDISPKIITLDLKENYEIDVLGLGEVYEVMSVERIQKKLARKYKNGKIYIASNKNHSGRGLSLEELENYLREKEIGISQKGYIDSPPWDSQPLTHEQRKSYSSNTVFLAKLIFFFLLPLEFLWRGPKRSHMVFCLSRNS